MPAGNFFLGFPGRYSSNQPCPHCKLVKRAYDPWMYTHQSKTCVHETADGIRTLMSSSICLRPDNILRPLFIVFVNDPMVRKSARFFVVSPFPLLSQANPEFPWSRSASFATVKNVDASPWIWSGCASDSHGSPVLRFYMVYQLFFVNV